MKKAILLFVLAFIKMSVLQAQDQKITLKVGDKAPLIKVEKWIKGDSFSVFEKGHIYVVEFGGIGCSPCRASIPHLSDVAKKYSKNVTVLSVYALDFESVSRVQQFVDKMGQQVKYNVAYDGASQAMSNSWMKAAGLMGIPQAFLIDGTGTIVWIGHPVYLEKLIIDQVINGHFDPQAAIVKQQEKIQQRSRAMIAAQKGDFKTALNSMNNFIKENPNDLFLYKQKFEIMLKTDETKAYLYGWELLKGKLKDSDAPLWYMAQQVCHDSESGTLNNPDWDLVIALADRAASLNKDKIVSACILKSKAEAYSKKGDYAKAVKVMQQAIQLLDEMPAAEAKGTFDYLSSDLAKYKQKLN